MGDLGGIANKIRKLAKEFKEEKIPDFIEIYVNI